MEVKRFYDEFVDHQVAVGVNERHRSIVRGLKRAGLRPSHRVLEIGCGIGTLTELLVDEQDAGGSILAVDISERSIEVARERLSSHANVEFLAADVIQTDVAGPFDVIVFPDVIEHIPLELHSRLFERAAGWLAPDGFMLLNYPNPHYLAWCQVHRPEVLQVVDQPINADVLLTNACPHGLYLDYLETYSIWVREGDYVLAVLRPESAIGTFTQIPDKPPSLLARVRGRIRRLVAR